jgi:methyltransferase
MASQLAYTALVACFALERVVELWVARRNAAASFARGAVEHGRRHYPPMVALHSALLAACVLETWLLDRPFIPRLGYPMLGLALGAQALRWWAIASLGARWNTRVIVLPGEPRVTRGPYRFITHPNYLAVAVEGIALPLVHGAWLTAAVFTALDAVLLSLRIRCENQALAWAESTARRYS